MLANPLPSHRRDPSARIGLRTAGRLSIALLLTLCAAEIHAEPFVYLANRAMRNFSVIDADGYNVIASGPIGVEPIALVANAATNKVFIQLTSSAGTKLQILDATTYAVSTEIQLTKTFSYTRSAPLAVTSDGSKVYVLTPGLISVIDPVAMRVVKTIDTDPSATSLALDQSDGALYVANWGGSDGVAGISIIDTAIDEIAEVINTDTFRPQQLAIHPDGAHLYMTGSTDGLNTREIYQVLDLNTFTLTSVKVNSSADSPPLSSLSKLVFNDDGSRLYFSGGDVWPFHGAIPFIEVDTASGDLLRVLTIPVGGNDLIYYVNKMVGATINNHFTLVIFLDERFRHEATQPPRVVFLDVVDGAVLKDLLYPNPPQTHGGFVIGDLMVPVVANGIQRQVKAKVGSGRNADK